MSNFSAPPLRFSTAAPKRRHSRSRKSPASSVPPGNWCDSFSVRAARPSRVDATTAGAATNVASAPRRVMPLAMCVLPGGERRRQGAAAFSLRLSLTHIQAKWMAWRKRRLAFWAARVPRVLPPPALAAGGGGGGGAGGGGAGEGPHRFDL